MYQLATVIVILSTITIWYMAVKSGIGQSDEADTKFLVLVDSGNKSGGAKSS